MSIVITVRPAVATDAAPIAHIKVATWQHAYRGIVPDAYLDAMAEETWEARWRENLARPERRITLVAEAAGQVVGFVTGGPEREPDAAFDGELYAIYVLPAHQGAGAGRALFEALVPRLREAGYRSMRLWVLEANAPARAFYEARGGRVGATKTVTMGGAELCEVAYGWPAL